MNKPLYVVAESFKFVRLFPLNQQDLPDEFKVLYYNSFLVLGIDILFTKFKCEKVEYVHRLYKKIYFTWVIPSLFLEFI